jgi:hypothetical protein
MAATIGSRFHEGGKIWPKGYESQATDDSSPDTESTMDL